jgi:hypothetical protein
VIKPQSRAGSVRSNPDRRPLRAVTATPGGDGHRPDDRAVRSVGYPARDVPGEPPRAAGAHHGPAIPGGPVTGSGSAALGERQVTAAGLPTWRPGDRFTRLINAIIPVWINDKIRRAGCRTRLTTQCGHR